MVERRRELGTLIFLALHVVQPVRLFLCVRRPTPVYPGGCFMDGFGRLVPEAAGVGGVEVVCSTEDAETGCSDGGSRPDIMEMSSRIRTCVSMIG